MILPKLELIWHPALTHIWYATVDKQGGRIILSPLAVRELAGPDPLLNRRDIVAGLDSHVKVVGEQDSRIPKPCYRALFSSTAAGFCGKARRSAPKRE